MRTQKAIETVTRLADAQYGVVARRQLLAAGVSRQQVGRRVRSGLLGPLHRGVYAVGHRRLTRDGVWLAAVLAAGDGALLSHRDAATLHGLGQWTYGPVEVTTAARVRSTARVRVHDRRRLASGDGIVVAGIPVTTVARTLVDLADALTYERLVRAASEVERTNVLDVAAVEEALTRVRVRGAGERTPAAALRAALDELAVHGIQLTRSELERQMRTG